MLFAQKIDIKKLSEAIMVLAWCILTVFNYKIIPYCIAPFLWLGLLFVLFVLSLKLIISLIQEWKNITGIRIRRVILCSVLFLLTLFYHKTNRVIEKLDWYFYFNNRNEVVEKVNNGDLNPNVGWSNSLCELPFEIPVISHGGNDIGISRCKDSNSITVKFWVHRAFMNHPSTYIIYTNNDKTIKALEERITINPDENWKYEENWYRIKGFY